MDLRDHYGRHPNPADLTACSACGQTIRREHSDPCPDCRAITPTSQERATVADADQPIR